MNIAIIGAGAMGSRIGYTLFEGGHDVLLIDEWQEHVATIKEEGLEVIKEKERYWSRIPIDFPAVSKGNFDWVFIVTKATQTADLLKKCQHIICNETRIVTLQNGLGNIEIMEQFVSREQLFAGVTTYASRIIEPGKIEALGTGYTEIMQVDGGDKNSTVALVDVLNESGFHTKISNNVINSIWSKAAFNCVLNPICTLMRKTVSSVGSYSKIDTLIDNVLEEVIVVADAEGIKLEKENITQMIKEVFDPAVSGNHISSMYHDIQNGRETEIEYLNGAIVKKGDNQSIPVPNNRLIYHLICMLEETSYAE